jgi:2-C-methyl-D-erythritol 4-phosphate cytidylyltransferase/2-C-methyl-D-erythritol 2,4-cyclodiphosphate synthase
LLPPVIGGAERTDSVRAGLAALAQYQPDFVLIHDAARPFLTQAMIGNLIIELTADEAVLPALPVNDTVRRFEGGKWKDVNRAALMRMQTPQVFPYARIRELVDATKKPVTDEAALWLAAGGALRYVDGDEDLRKVTTSEDIVWAEHHASLTRNVRRTAVGMGFDVHALMPSGEKGTIRLAGLDIVHHHTLHGHSDADVVLHAIVDALLGSIAAGDIGSHFPPADARWKGADSAIFVAEAGAQVKARGGIIQHLDVTIIGEHPKVSPHREAMRARIAELLELPLSAVSVKATTTEKLGFTGREEGIAAQAVATVTLPAEAA